MWKYAQFLLVLVPFITELIETGRLPSSLSQLTTDIILAIIIALFCWSNIRMLKRMTVISETDGLTGLYNRRKFNQDIEEEVTRAHRLDSALTLAYIDVDNFKTVNDSKGHDEGDKILIGLADLLTSLTRIHVDTCYRLGGDEFVVILNGAKPENAQQVFERISSDAQHISPCLNKIRWRVLFGGHLFGLQENESSHELLQRGG